MTPISKIPLIALPLLIASTVCSQPFTPTFQVAFYFEDAVGNRDTLLIWGDTIFPNEVYDTTAYRGEVVTETDVSKPFEVFTLPSEELFYKDIFWPGEFWYGFHPVGYNYYKNVVVHHDSLLGAESVFLLFKCAHYPIKVQWADTFFFNLAGYNLLRGSHFLPDHTRFSNQDLFPPVDFTITKFKCLRYDGSWQFHLGAQEDYNRPFEKVYGFLDTPTDTLYGLLLNFSPYFNCSEVSGVGTPEGGEGLRVFPNPAKSALNIRLPDGGLPGPGVLRVYAPGGQFMCQTPLPQQAAVCQAPMEGLPAGMYFYEITIAGRSVQRGKLIKH